MTDVLDKSRRLPPQEAEEYSITMERVRRFHETGKGIPLAKLKDWMERRHTDPSAPCPKPEKLS